MYTGPPSRWPLPGVWGSPGIRTSVPPFQVSSHHSRNPVTIPGIQSTFQVSGRHSRYPVTIPGIRSPFQVSSRHSRNLVTISGIQSTFQVSSHHSMYPVTIPGTVAIPGIRSPFQVFGIHSRSSTSPYLVVLQMVPLVRNISFLRRYLPPTYLQCYSEDKNILFEVPSTSTFVPAGSA